MLKEAEKKKRYMSFKFNNKLLLNSTLAKDKNFMAQAKQLEMKKFKLLKR
jgi:hypothetical protein